MFSRLIHSRGFFPILLLLAVAVYWWSRPNKPKIVGTAYVAERQVTLWNSMAQVNQPVAIAHYGDRLEIVKQDGGAAQVRTADGITGWLLDSRQLMDPQLWQRSADLLAKAHGMPVQARGKTKTVSNVRIEPGRNGSRVYQLARGVPVVILQRTVAEVSASENAAADTASADRKDQKSAAEATKPKQEDWFFILRDVAKNDVAANGPARGTTSNVTVDNADRSGARTPVAETPENAAEQVGPASGNPVSSGRPMASDDGPAQTTPIAGWVLARFIELEPPDTIKDYISASNLHVVAWFELNRVPDGSGGDAPQYLVAAARGGEGQACDFTLLRVYTWGAARKRYETAYAESNVCGELPIRISQTPAGPEFRFTEGEALKQERVYAMKQTAVRRVREGKSPAQSRTLRQSKTPPRR